MGGEIKVISEFKRADDDLNTQGSTIPPLLYRPTRAIIDLSSLEYNFRNIKSRLPEGTAILAVVKADAYGHGAIEVARRLESIGCDLLGVALCEEGMELRMAGIKCPILILGGIFPNQVDSIFDFDLTPIIFDKRSAQLLGEAAEQRGRRLCVHLKIDTGMGRLGVSVEELGDLLTEIDRLKWIDIEGVMSHLAEADSEDDTYTSRQVARFRDAVEAVSKAGFNPRYIHIANSAAIVAFPDATFNLVRPGIMLYGVYPSQRFKKDIELRHVMTLTTEILQLKRVKKGSPISYGRTFVTTRDSLIGVIPIGYGDGFVRLLSNRGRVIVRGRSAPIVGRICMDLTMIDITDIDGVEIGEEVVLIGEQGGERIEVDEVAEKAGTIPYEIFCNISPRVQREYTG